MRIGPLGEAVLGAVALAGLLTVAVAAPNALQLFMPRRQKISRTHTQQVKRNIDSLIRNGLMKRVVDKEGNPALGLTSKGKWEALIRHRTLEVHTKSKKRVWDGKWRLVIFDVPNTKSKIRSELRRAMKLYGFVMIQKSVWAYPYMCDDFVVVLKAHLGVSDDVFYLTADMMENENALKKEFNL